MFRKSHTASLLVVLDWIVLLRYAQYVPAYNVENRRLSLTKMIINDRLVVIDENFRDFSGRLRLHELLQRLPQLGLQELLLLLESQLLFL